MKRNSRAFALAVVLFAVPFFLGCSVESEGYYPSVTEAHLLNKNDLDSKAWICIYGKESCLAVFKKNDYKTQRRIYAYLEDESVQWIDVKTIKILGVPNEKTDVNNCTVSVLCGENCNDIFISGSFTLESSLNDVTICDNLGSVFQTYRYRVSEKKGIDAVYFYCCANGYENEQYQLLINGIEIMSIGHSLNPTEQVE